MEWFILILLGVIVFLMSGLISAVGEVTEVLCTINDRQRAETLAKAKEEQEHDLSQCSS